MWILLKRKEAARESGEFHHTFNSNYDYYSMRHPFCGIRIHHLPPCFTILPCTLIINNSNLDETCVHLVCTLPIT